MWTGERFLELCLDFKPLLGFGFIFVGNDVCVDIEIYQEEDLGFHVVYIHWGRFHPFELRNLENRRTNQNFEISTHFCWLLPTLSFRITVVCSLSWAPTL